MKYEIKDISGWGRYVKAPCKIFAPPNIIEACQTIKKEGVISRGLGRSYGDASLNENRYVCKTLFFDKFVDFDCNSGLLRCESGVSLNDILQVFTPNGWFLPVTPGTKHVTVGGAIACDVHGKNHHKDGSFSRFVKNIWVLTSDSNVLKCSREQNSDLFWATVGGMGLTGIIIEAEIQLKKIDTSYIKCKTLKFKNIDELFDGFNKNDKAHTYSVAWIDTVLTGKKFGRSVLFVGDHANLNEVSKEISDPLKVLIEKKPKIPFGVPSFFVDPFMIKISNAFYFSKHKNSESIAGFDKFFYPLDAIENWNRIYGKKGFLQYQLVLPIEKGVQGVTEIIDKVVRYGGSSLSVIKKMGEQEGILSFPMKGYTLTLDFPVKAGLMDLIKELDRIVIGYGGRVYLAKDATLDERTFKLMYDGKWQKWLEIKNKYDSEGIFTSNLSRRIGLCRY